MNEIKSIGWLYGVDGIILTPIFNGQFFPKKVTITKEEFQEVKNDINKMKKLALKKIYN